MKDVGRYHQKGEVVLVRRVAMLLVWSGGLEGLGMRGGAKICIHLYVFAVCICFTVVFWLGR